MIEEIWKDIKDYEWIYQVSNFGNIKSLWNNKNRKEKILKQIIRQDMRKNIVLFNHNIKKMFIVSRLIAQSFLWLDINDKKMLVCHKDDNPSNNNVTNLFLWTSKDNTQDMVNKWRSNKLKYYLYITKPINQYDKQWNFIKTWNWCREAERITGIFNTAISQCCKWKSKTSWWFIWKYA